MLRKIRRWVTLAPADRAAAAEAWLLLAASRLALRWLGFTTTVRLLGAVAGRSAPPATPAARLKRWVDAAAASQPGRARCLARSVALRAMLERRGQEAALRIGVRRLGEGLEAHAWIECGGGQIVDGEAGGYRALLPAAH